MAQWLARALLVGGPIVSKLASKYGLAGTLIGEALANAGNEARTGLNYCVEAWYNNSKASSYRCGVTVEYLEADSPPYLIFTELLFENCFEYTRYKKEKVSCIPRYKINLIWPL